MTDVDIEHKAPRMLRTPKELTEAGLLAPDQVASAEKVGENFSIGVSREILTQIRTSKNNSSLMRQFVPDVKELTVVDEERPDPIGDTSYMPIKGITHRYPDRLLLIPNHTCAVYCRFCFRREKVGPGQDYLTAEEMQNALEYIRQHKQLREVILTGGDPLVLSARRIASLVRELSAMEHLDLIRFHTRVPVVAPELVTPEILKAMESDKIVCIVVHANSAEEFGDPARQAIRSLRKAGLMMVAHSVLLKGVNDTPEAMTALLREFVRNGVKPYYLHHCDLAEGTSHFRTTFEEGQALMRAIRGTVSGLAQPNYVMHIASGHGKVPIGPTYLEKEGDHYIVTDYLGGRHVYPPRAGE